MTRARLARLAAVFALASTFSPVALGRAAVETCPAAVTKQGDGWEQIRAPAFTIGPRTLRDYAVVPSSPNVLFATNGSVVMRSTDGGCSWQDSYVPAEIGTEPLPSINLNTIDIRSIEVAHAPAFFSGFADYVYIVAVQALRPVVLRSTDQGETWVEKSRGLPPEAGDPQLRLLTNPVAGFLTAQSTAGQFIADLYRTTDGGDTWELSGAPLEPYRFRDIAIDPLNINVLWAWNTTGLYHSTDAGTTFTRVPAVGSAIGAVDVFHNNPRTPSRPVVYHGLNATAARSVDGGKTWRFFQTPGPITSASHEFLREFRLMSSAAGLHVQYPTSQSIFDISPGAARLDGAALTTPLPSALPQAFGMTDAAIYRRQLAISAPPGQRPVFLPPVNLEGGRAAKIPPSTLTPKTTTVRLLPGQSRRVEYRLDLAPTPTPMDIFFETDSTGSMQPVIAGLRRDFQDIINDLADSGVDVHFGIADFRDYPVPGWGQPTDYPYLLRRKIGPVNDELKDAIESIQTGGGQGLDSSLAAAYQAATGEGQAVVGTPGGPRPAGAGYWVEPGTGAEFRPEALKIIVLAQDVRSRHPDAEIGYPGPTFSTVIRTLNAAGIKLVGLAVGNSPDSADGPRVTLEPLARGTGTVAPEGGTDCDADRDIDIPAGEPLVCTLRPQRGGSTSVAPAMVSLLRSVEDRGDIDLGVMGDRRVVRLASPARIENINVKAHNILRYAVTYSCDETTVDATYPVTLTALSVGRPVATATATVECLPAPLDAPPAIRPIAALAAAAAPAPAPPPVQPQLNPNPNPNPQVNANTQAQLNAAMAQQEQEEVNLALAYIDDPPSETIEQLAMSDRRSEQRGAMATVLLAGVATTIAAGVAMQRQRTQPSCVIVRRD